MSIKSKFEVINRQTTDQPLKSQKGVVGLFEFNQQKVKLNATGVEELNIYRKKHEAPSEKAKIISLYDKIFQHKRPDSFLDLHSQLSFNQGGQSKPKKQKLFKLEFGAFFIDLFCVLYCQLSLVTLVYYVSLRLKYEFFLQLVKTDMMFLSLSLGVSFFSLIWFYCVASRCLMGATIGEWSCQIQLGRTTHYKKMDYMIKVVLRTSVIMLTGFFVIPLLSYLLKKDILNQMFSLAKVRKTR